MNKKMIVAALTGVGVASAVLYFKKNPEKFEAMKHKMIAKAYDLEDEMM